MTNGDRPDGHVGEMSVRAAVVRLGGESTTTCEEEQRMQYALLIYSTTEGSRPEAERLGPIDPRIAAVLERPSVLNWARLRDPESATTIRHEAGKTLLVDGPFIDSKEFLGGVIVVEADDLDGALAIADELQQTRTDGAIEVRPLLP
jgi:hypothetical protein